MKDLIEEALQHRAVKHPYLLGLKIGQFENMDAVLRDFAHQYGFYSEWFPRYLTATISKLENPEHRNALLSNLAEEGGLLHDEDLLKLKAQGIHPDWVQGIPHPQLFKRFQQSMQTDASQAPGIEVELWREQFLQLIQQGNSAHAIGAIGLGTESIVKYIYRDLIEAITRHTNLQLKDYVFFPLHTEVDDEHGLILLNIASEISQNNPHTLHEIRKGMLAALNLRAAFWDGLSQRAMNIHSYTNHDALIC